MSNPNIIFIIPYRDREDELKIFRSNINQITSNYETNEVDFLIIHQCDSRTFNRGAMKNIGFHVVKTLYPKNYKNITLVFNDVDICVNKNVDFEPENGSVKHFYGYLHTLGGIVSIKANDFERVNGFPNFWSWGFEDKLFQKRIMKENMKIDRSTFFELESDESHVTNKEFTVSYDDNERSISKKECLYCIYGIKLGLDDIKDLEYNLVKENDISFVNVVSFNTTNSEPTDCYSYRKGVDTPQILKKKFKINKKLPIIFKK